MENLTATITFYNNHIRDLLQIIYMLLRCVQQQLLLLVSSK